MSFFGPRNFYLECTLGNIPGYGHLNKFGQTTDADKDILTDVWSGADGVTSTSVWIAPTSAQIHNLASTDAADDGNLLGTGMRTCRVYGLRDWDTPEINEVVVLNGTSNAPTVNPYVIIHRKVGLTFGSAETNIGIITATAIGDGTVTAAIIAGEGQTLMAIYGVPSTQTVNLLRVEADVLKTGAGGGGTVKVDGTLLVKENADLPNSAFITKQRFQFTDTSALRRPYVMPKPVLGPAIIKVQINSSVNGSMITAAFDACLVDS